MQFMKNANVKTIVPRPSPILREIRAIHSQIFNSFLYSLRYYYSNLFIAYIYLFLAILYFFPLILVAARIQFFLLNLYGLRDSGCLGFIANSVRAVHSCACALILFSNIEHIVVYVLFLMINHSR